MALIVLGVSSSISLYKACEVLRGFQKAGHDVQVVMTPNAAKLVTPYLFSSLSGRRAIVELFDEALPWNVAHVALAKEAALFCVAPATANVIAKLAWGVADDFLSTFYLAVEAPVLVAPAMHEAMLAHPRTAENIRRLRESAVEIVGPETGYLACGDEGPGRLAAPETIVKRGLELLARSRSLEGRSVLVTAGPTRERLDAVRFLSNRSSGRMGYEIAAEALRRGASVKLVTGPVSLVPPRGAEVVAVESAAEMDKAVRKALPGAGIVVMAAAVADAAFPRPAAGKIKKGDLPRRLELVPTPDILAAAGAAKAAGQVLVGFAAETSRLKANALDKLRRKHLDLIVANDVSKPGLGFDSDRNAALIIDARGRTEETGTLAKRELAGRVWDAIERILRERKA